jgi:hypothetical protein
MPPTTNPQTTCSGRSAAVLGTCQWSLEHEKYLKWIDARGSSLSWVTAYPGCGKSVLASFLVDHLRQQEESNCRTNISYFFFKDDSDQERSSTFALSAILHQLFIAISTLA